MNITNYLIQAYKDNLTKRYEQFKEKMSKENFVPDAECVSEMYTDAFKENHGAYYLMNDLLDLEQYDSNGRLNELQAHLDHVNAMYSDYCSAYISGLRKQTS